MGFSAAYSRERNLWGETLLKGAHDQTVSVGYRLKKYYFSAGVLTPFVDKWSAGWENLSKLMPGKGWTFMGAASPLVYLNFSWNIAWGKKYKAQQKELNNEDSDAGIFNVKDK